jgi:galactitol-specific phosphotransferase system IIC component
MWALAVTGSVLILFGQFWLGLMALLCAAAVRIIWGDWSKREQACFDAGANELRQ